MAKTCVFGFPSRMVQATTSWRRHNWFGPQGSCPPEQWFLSSGSRCTLRAPLSLASIHCRTRRILLPRTASRDLNDHVSCKQNLTGKQAKGRKVWIIHSSGVSEITNYTHCVRVSASHLSHSQFTDGPLQLQTTRVTRSSHSRTCRQGPRGLFRGFHVAS